MDLTIIPRKLRGTIKAIPSKSQAHRLLICAAFSSAPTTLHCPETNQDIEATARCLTALGAKIIRTDSGYEVIPVTQLPSCAEMDCGESGSTLRFILPVVCALGVETKIHMSGRLPYRPLSPLWEELERMGCSLSKPTEDMIQTSGKLRNGTFAIPGNVSSQYISGLLFALSLLDGSSNINITGILESKPYVDMTLRALQLFGASIENYCVHSSFPLKTPGNVNVEGDWSNAAFFLVAKALGNVLYVTGLDQNSPQGDRAIMDLLQIEDSNPTISAADIPDLVPILSVLFAAKNGATFTNISRLRLKESDRVKTVIDMLAALGIHAEATEDTLIVYGGHFQSGTVDAHNDHRIAMSAAIAATLANGPVKIIGAECVAKSYPAFWKEYKRLGGHYE